MRKGIVFIADVLLAIVIFTTSLYLLSSNYRSNQALLSIKSKLAEDILCTLEKLGAFGASQSIIESEIEWIIPKNYAANLSIHSFRYNGTFVQLNNISIQKNELGEWFVYKKRMVYLPSSDEYVLAEIKIGDAK